MLEDSIRFRSVASVLSILLLPVLSSETAEAQVATAVYGDTTVEVIGLSKWTVEELQEAVHAYAPDVTLAEHACAVVLRDSVGFADASAMRMPGRAGRPTWVILTVVEPDKKHLVRYRGTDVPASELRPEHGRIADILRRDPAAVGYLQHTEILVEGAHTIFGESVPSSVDSLRSALTELGDPADFKAAVESILRDSNRDNRAIGAMVLSNFATRDSAWYVLVEAVRTRPDHAASTAEMVMSALAKSDRYEVDWTPARESLTTILGGTNLFAYIDMLEILVRTDIEPELGRELVRVNPDLILDNATAANPITPGPARAFLRHVTGEDHGSNRLGWQQALGLNAE